MQQIYCTTQPKKNQADQEWEFKRNCLVLKSDLKLNQGEMIEAISKKQLDKLDRKIQELQKFNGDGSLNVIIEGKSIKPI